MKKLFRYRAENSPRGWLFLAPALIFIAIFNVTPLIRTFVIAFQKGTLNNPEFAGISNFQRVLADPVFHKAIRNTALYAFIVVPAGMVISLFIAMSIHKRMKLKKVWESIFFLPYLTSMIAIGIVFRFLFNQDYGLINYLLGLFGVSNINWLNSPEMSMTTVIIFGIWMGLAFNIIILLTGLRNIDDSYYKVADMFGATKREQFFRITLPQLIPTITFLLLMNFISAFKIYGQVFSLFNGRPGVANSATTGVFYIFTEFYTNNNYGKGMAAAVILFVVILIFTLIQRLIMKKISK
ncbi:carbohydrate ABC transporter permease [Helcococcus massiliensis]|uniref:carbohydrate ABC transporter permease n=1 Tax=Helcococcus massiliensis TaxID=2040290 RepID=UPI000CDE9B7D|nr:sugar ABC transporter permease [Helcococcus massiliensis]